MWNVLLQILTVGTERICFTVAVRTQSAVAFRAVHIFQFPERARQNLTASAAVSALSVIAAPYLSVAVAIAAAGLPVQNTAIVYGIAPAIVSARFVVEFEFSPKPVSIVACIAGPFMLAIALVAFSGSFAKDAFLHAIIIMADAAFAGTIAIPTSFVAGIGSGSFASAGAFSGSLARITLFGAGAITVSAGSVSASIADDFPRITVMF